MISKVCLALLISALCCIAFSVGSYYGETTFEPKVVYIETPIEVEKVVEVEVIKEVPVEIIKEVPVPTPIELREFEDLDELNQFLEADDTNEVLRLYPIRGTDGRMSLGDDTCDYYALNLQERALKAGYLMSTEIIKQNHMINSTVIGNEIYFIEPQSDKVWFWGVRQREQYSR